MKARRRVPRRKTNKIFRKTAKRVKAINVAYIGNKGGVRL